MRRVLSGRCLAVRRGHHLLAAGRDLHARPARERRACDRAFGAVRAGGDLLVGPEDARAACTGAAAHARRRGRPLGRADPARPDRASRRLDPGYAAPALCLARPELIDDARAGRGAGELIALEPLSPSESDELIEELLGGSRLEMSPRSRIREVAEGNPLFVEQMVARLAEGGDPERVPPTIQALLAAGWTRSPTGARGARAGLGRGARVRVGGARQSWPRDRRRPAGALLAALVRKELIRPHEAIEDAFRFRHMLIRDAAYERIPKELRSELHERFAGWLEGSGEEFDEIIGYHLEQAYHCLIGLGRPGCEGEALAERAAERLAESGRRAYARGDIAGGGEPAGASGGLASGRRPASLDCPAVPRSSAEGGGSRGTRGSRALGGGRAWGAGGRAGGSGGCGVALSDLRFHRTCPDRRRAGGRPA